MHSLGALFYLYSMNVTRVLHVDIIGYPPVPCKNEWHINVNKIYKFGHATKRKHIYIEV